MIGLISGLDIQTLAPYIRKVLRPHVHILDVWASNLKSPQRTMRDDQYIITVALLDESGALATNKIVAAEQLPGFIHLARPGGIYKAYALEYDYRLPWCPVCQPHVFHDRTTCRSFFCKTCKTQGQHLDGICKRNPNPEQSSANLDVHAVFT